MGAILSLELQTTKKIEGVDPNCVEKLCKQIANLSNNPEKLDPQNLIDPQVVDYKDKKLIYFFVPASSQVQSPVA
jgi:hypothetical protein